MWALWDFDSKGLCMEKILHIFHNLKKHVLSLKGEPFRLDHDMANARENVFSNCWTMVRIDLHYVGALLKLYLLHDKELTDDNDSFITCKSTLQKLCPLETYPDVVQDFLALQYK